MSTPEPVAPSRRLRSAAEAERERLGKELERLDGRVEQLQAELEQLQTRRSELREQLALLARLAWDPADSTFPTRSTGKVAHLQAVPAEQTPAKAILRGARIRETAVRLLASSPNPRRPIHYQQWFKMLRDAGYGIDAHDPLGTFLTQISRSPVVRRADAPGVYALDFAALAALRERLTQLEQKLRQPGLDHDTAEDIALAREQRAKLLTAIRATERQLEDALRSLGEGGDEGEPAG